MLGKPIGIFDSGVGGLTVLREIEKLLPFENIVYFGDTARVPYGNKSKSTIIKFSCQSVRFLRTKKVKLIVIACNTSSSLALNKLKQTFNIPILGMIKSGVNSAIKISQKRRIGIIGTKATIKSNSYQRLILGKDKRIKVYAQSCPLFVPLAEEGLLKGKAVREVMNMYLKNLKKKDIDTIILGCTHYPLLWREIASYLKGVAIVDSAKEIACGMRGILKSKGLLNRGKRKGRVEFYVSDEPKEFVRLAKLFLKRKIPNPRIANV
ncbi:MAG: glutamate racemase [Candidatus Omnitrophica bacterium]|nr:glutamate racemase [Candidatus Omnitrophota bacterium]